MIQLVGYGMKDSISIIGLLIELFEIIKFDGIIPLPALSKMCSQNRFTFEKNFYVILWRMNGGNAITICKMPSFEKVCLNINTRNGIDILDALFGSKREKPKKERKINLEVFHVFDPFCLYVVPEISIHLFKPSS